LLSTTMQPKDEGEGNATQGQCSASKAKTDPTAPPCALSPPTPNHLVVQQVQDWVNGVGGASAVHTRSPAVAASCLFFLFPAACLTHTGDYAMAFIAAETVCQLAVGVSSDYPLRLFGWLGATMLVLVLHAACCCTADVRVAPSPSHHTSHTIPTQLNVPLPASPCLTCRRSGPSLLTTTCSHLLAARSSPNTKGCWRGSTV
jgi:hypothetical protein